MIIIIRSNIFFPEIYSDKETNGQTVKHNLFLRQRKKRELIMCVVVRPLEKISKKAIDESPIEDL